MALVPSNITFYLLKVLYPHKKKIEGIVEFPDIYKHVELININTTTNNVLRIGM